MPEEQKTVKGQRKTGFRGVNPQDINRDGGPPKTGWWSILLAEKAEAEDRERKLKNKEIMAEALVTKCKQGDISALKEFGDRVQGKSKDFLDFTSGGEKVSGFLVQLVDAKTSPVAEET